MYVSQWNNLLERKPKEDKAWLHNLYANRIPDGLLLLCLRCLYQSKKAKYAI